MKSTTFDLPVWFVPAYANQDFSAISDEETEEYHAIVDEITTQVDGSPWTIDYNHEDHPSPGFPELGTTRRLMQDVVEVRICYHAE